MTRVEAINYFKESMAIGEDDDIRHHNEVLEFTIKTLEQEACDDTVSREAVKELFQEGSVMGMYYFLGIDKLPSVTLTRKKGKWINTDVTILNRQVYLVHEVICSECDGISYFRLMGNKYIGANYCQNCGAKMEEGKL